MKNSPNISLLMQAKHEIMRLRKENQILAAKVSVIDVFSAALLGLPRSQGMTLDIVWELEEEAKRLSEPEKEEQKKQAA